MGAAFKGGPFKGTLGTILEPFLAIEASGGYGAIYEL